jgi:UDP-N-acetyl-D-mannosaminuronic acid transferase (WecB/TagA/CpsF family)
MAISALAVHGLMARVLHSKYNHCLPRFDLLLPDGEPGRWALNLLHWTQFRDRVCGPTLTLALSSRAESD